MNCLYPPFDNPAVKHALLGAINQADFMAAVAGADTEMWRDKAGVFTPSTPLATDVGIELLPAKPDYDKVKRDLAAAGYKGEKVVLLAATDSRRSRPCAKSPRTCSANPASISITRPWIGER